MAIRMIVAMLVGTALAFGWGAVSWTSGMWGFAFRPMPGSSPAITGEAVVAVMSGAADRDAAYIHPSPPETSGMTAQQSALARESYLAEHRRGPLVMVLVRNQGVDPSGPTVLLKGFLIELFCTALLAAIIGTACKFGARLQDRLALGVLVPAFAVLSTHGVLWNFMHLPDAYALALFLDGMAAWTLAGIACAIIIRPGKG